MAVPYSGRFMVRVRGRNSRRSRLHPWDAAHQIAQGRLPGSEQFAASGNAYVEPDILNTRQYPATGAATAAAAVGAASAKPAEGHRPCSRLAD